MEWNSIVAQSVPKNKNRRFLAFYFVENNRGGRGEYPGILGEQKDVRIAATRQLFKILKLAAGFAPFAPDRKYEKK